MRRVLLASLALLLGSCIGLRVVVVDSAFREPSNVAVYFTVDTAGGEPVRCV